MDRRTRKTQTLIKSIFLHLIKEKPLNKITVSEITQLADIGRGTFYTHYVDIYDLYTQIIREALLELNVVFDQAYPNADYSFHHLANDLVTYVANNQTVFRLLLTDSLENALIKEFKKVLTEKISKAEQLPLNNKTRIELSFTISGVIGVLSEWLDKELDISAPELIQILDQIMTEY